MTAPIIGNVPAGTQANLPQATPIHEHTAASTAAPRIQAVVTGGTSTANDENTFQKALRQIASAFKDTYAVSDKQFTIFKDADGNYITRYVSLRDGSITYLPNPPVVVRPLPVTTEVASRLSVVT